MNGHATNDILKKMTIGYQGIGIGIGIIVEKIKNLRLVWQQYPFAAITYFSLISNSFIKKHSLVF